MTKQIPMKPEIKALYEQARKLSDDDRAELVDLLTNCLGADNGLSPAWRDEIDRRSQALERGEMESYPADEVMQRLRARLRK
jgi:putative addiction module component (TIGR02574 family)